jgi:hypothetical protein
MVQPKLDHPKVGSGSISRTNFFVNVRIIVNGTSKGSKSNGSKENKEDYSKKRQGEETSDSHSTVQGDEGGVETSFGFNRTAARGEL